MQLKYTLFSSISMLAFSSLSVFSQTEKMNVLFLMADDMRPELGCYGVKEVKTPNIDRFAASGLLFQNAYCNIPVSGASRASLLTGVYPHYPDRFVNYSAYASKDCPTAIPISRWFTSHGYYTISNGKVFHHLSDHANSWSEPPYRKHPDGYDVYWAEYNKWELWMNEASARTINPKTMRGPFCEWAEVPDTAYDDGKLALKAIADLKRLKEQGKPFFMACGFWKPHLPFNAPKKYWDLYDREKIPVANNRFRPKDLPNEVKNSTEIYAYARTTTADDISFQKEAKHGYYLYLRHTQTEFFSVGKYLVLGALVSALFQPLDRSFPWGNGGDGLFLPLPVLMGMAFFLSLCSSAYVLVARSFAGQFPMGALMGFMVFGPMMDIKNLILLSGGFSRKFVLRLCLTSFCICGMVVFLAFSTGLERSLL